jgi:hypothetical protein
MEKNVMYSCKYKMQKISSKKFTCMKIYVGAKGHVILVYSNTIGSIYLIWTLKDYFSLGEGLLKRHYRMTRKLFL